MRRWAAEYYYCSGESRLERCRKSLQTRRIDLICNLIYCRVSLLGVMVGSISITTLPSAWFLAVAFFFFSLFFYSLPERIRSNKRWTPGSAHPHLISRPAGRVRSAGPKEAWWPMFAGNNPRFGGGFHFFRVPFYRASIPSILPNWSARPGF